MSVKTVPGKAWRNILNPEGFGCEAVQQDTALLGGSGPQMQVISTDLWNKSTTPQFNPWAVWKSI